MTPFGLTPMTKLAAMWLAISAWTGCAPLPVPVARPFVEYPASIDDAAVLGVAMDTLCQGATGCDQGYLVVRDSPTPPSFPKTKARAERDAALFLRLDRGEPTSSSDRVWAPWDPPDPGVDLDLLDGPVVPWHIVSSSLEREHSVSVLPRPQTSLDVRLADGPRVDQMFKRDAIQGWRHFRRLYRGASGVIALSAPGYNADRNTAIVSASFQRGPLDGVGVFYILSKENGWHVVWSAGLWVS